MVRTSLRSKSRILRARLLVRPRRWLKRWRRIRSNQSMKHLPEVAVAVAVVVAEVANVEAVVAIVEAVVAEVVATVTGPRRQLLKPARCTRKDLSSREMTMTIVCTAPLCVFRL
jgi:hypothetical protein